MNAYSTMDEAFVIMQIGDAGLDLVWREAIAPAIADAGFAPRRIDRHNEGDLLKSEIVRFIERSQIIVADVTNERPNCYLEIGYAMGLGKKAHLILTARADHHHSSAAFKRAGPRIHFDLEGYDILLWDPDDLLAFRTELAKRIHRRATSIRPTAPGVAPQETDAWVDDLRTRGLAGLTGVDRSGYMEIVARIQPPGDWTQNRLVDAVRAAEIHTFGWPIAVTLDNRDEYRPRPTTDGVEAEVAIAEGDLTGRRSYDLWKVFKDGRFYTLLSLFEDERIPDSLFWDTRIVRITEALLFLVRLYRRLDASDRDEVTVSVRHGGLTGRTLRVANTLRMTHSRTTSQAAAESTFTASLSKLESDVVDYVKLATQPLFVIFDFFELDDTILREVAEGFIAKKFV